MTGKRVRHVPRVGLLTHVRIHTQKKHSYRNSEQYIEQNRKQNDHQNKYQNSRHYRKENMEQNRKQNSAQNSEQNSKQISLENIEQNRYFVFRYGCNLCHNMSLRDLSPIKPKSENYQNQTMECQPSKMEVRLH